MPKKVFSQGVKVPSGSFDHVVTQYIYEDGKAVTAEGGWLMSSGFGFEMSFNVVLEKATIIFDCTRQPAFKICPFEAEPITPPLQEGDGYLLEIKHFIKSVAGEKTPQITTPQQSLDSIKLTLAEKQSAETANIVII